MQQQENWWNEQAWGQCNWQDYEWNDDSKKYRDLVENEEKSRGKGASKTPMKKKIKKKKEKRDTPAHRRCRIRGYYGKRKNNVSTEILCFCPNFIKTDQNIHQL